MSEQKTISQLVQTIHAASHEWEVWARIAKFLSDYAPSEHRNPTKIITDLGIVPDKVIVHVLDQISEKLSQLDTQIAKIGDTEVQHGNQGERTGGGKKKEKERGPKTRKLLLQTGRSNDATPPSNPNKQSNGAKSKSA